MSWLIFSLMTAIGFGLADTFTKVASDKISSVSGVVFLHLTSGMIALMMMFLLPVLGFEKQNITQSGIIYSVIAGIFMFMGAAGYFFMFERGAPLGVGVAVTMLVTISVATLIGVIFLKETLSVQQVLGFLLAGCSICLLTYKQTT